MRALKSGRVERREDFFDGSCASAGSGGGSGCGGRGSAGVVCRGLDEEFPTVEVLLGEADGDGHVRCGGEVEVGEPVQEERDNPCQHRDSDDDSPPRRQTV